MGEKPATSFCVGFSADAAVSAAEREIYALVKACARAERRSVSACVLDACREWLKRREMEAKIPAPLG